MSSASAALRPRRTIDLAPLYKGLFLIIVAVFVAVPLLATILGGFKSLGELRTSPFGIPHVWEWQNYAGILFSGRYWRLLGNSLVIAGLDGRRSRSSPRRWPRSCSRT